MLSPARTPHVDAEERKAIVARSLAIAVAHAGSSIVSIAAAMAVSPSLVRQWLDPDANKPLSIANALALPPVVRRAIAELLASSLGCELVETTETDAGARVAKLATRSHEAVAKLAEAVADGHVSPGEGAELVAVGKALSQEGQTLIRLGQQAIVERGVKVRA
jgi:cobalamin biosynthesis protein CbiG